MLPLDLTIWIKSNLLIEVNVQRCVYMYVYVINDELKQLHFKRKMHLKEKVSLT